jgi:hypothetical protein
MVGMRAVLVVATLVGTAVADPEAALRVQPRTDPNGYTGEIIVPPKDFADARPWPQGMVIIPKDANPDRMPNLLLRPWRWGQRGLWHRFEDLTAGVIDALTSPQL